MPLGRFFTRTRCAKANIERAWIYNNGVRRTYADLTAPPPGSAIDYDYDDPDHIHAATALSSGESYSYDANGNMTQRAENGLTYNQTFDAENRLISVTVNSQTTQFVYNGDGNLVKKINSDGSKTIYPSTAPRKAAAPLTIVPEAKWEGRREQNDLPVLIEGKHGSLLNNAGA